MKKLRLEQCALPLSQEQSQKALESSLEQARALLQEMQALAREDLAMPSQVEQLRGQKRDSHPAVRLDDDLTADCRSRCSP
jgi:ABC-type phosphate transport system auxiliary subunit